jgi:hypothetical protein
MTEKLHRRGLEVPRAYVPLHAHLTIDEHETVQAGWISRVSRNRSPSASPAASRPDPGPTNGRAPR